MAEIITLFGTFQSPKDLVAYSDAQYLALESAANKIKDLEEKIKHLESLLSTAYPINTIIKSPAEAICEMQIEGLQQVAMIRPLSLEETKMLDLFVKNSRLLRGDSTVINAEVKKKPKNEYTEAQLIQIASKVDSNET